MDIFDTPEQLDARESSLVCRENGKLRKRVAELEQERADALNTFRTTLAERPTVADLEAARKQADDAKGSGAEAIQELATMRERLRQLENEREAERNALSDERTAAEEACKDAREREKVLNAELEALRLQLASEKAAQASVQLANDDRAAEQRATQELHGRLALAEAAEAAAKAELANVRAAAEENERRMTDVHTRRVAALQEELNEARQRLIAMQAGSVDAGSLRAERAALQEDLQAETRMRQAAEAQLKSELVRLAFAPQTPAPQPACQPLELVGRRKSSSSRRPPEHRPAGPSRESMESRAHGAAGGAGGAARKAGDSAA